MTALGFLLKAGADLHGLEHADVRPIVQVWAAESDPELLKRITSQTLPEALQHPDLVPFFNSAPQQVFADRSIVSM